MSVAPGPTLLLTRSDVAAVLDIGTCIAAVEDAFRDHAEGRLFGPESLGVAVEGGSFHVKAAGMRGLPGCFAAKMNANFPANPSRHGLPAIQGVVILSDAESGRVLALMDSIEITIQRTAAATAVAARYLARPKSRIAALCGCGAQAAAQIRALARILPLEHVLAFDVRREQIAPLAAALARDPGVVVEPADELSAALGQADVVVTCTPSRLPFLTRAAVRPGAFIAAIGADSPLKSEIDPALMASATVVTDILDQCAESGDLHHAIEACVMTKADVHAELGEIVAGRKPGRRSTDEITLFDSTGTALQDVAAARRAYERARATGYGRPLDLAA